jgi:hypothetical protein
MKFALFNFWDMQKFLGVKEQEMLNFYTVIYNRGKEDQSPQHGDFIFNEKVIKTFEEFMTIFDKDEEIREFLDFADKIALSYRFSRLGYEFSVFSTGMIQRFHLFP